METKSKLRDGKALSTVAMIAVGFVIAASTVRAQSELELISGSATVTVDGVNGFASYNGSVGTDWNVNVATGLAIPTDAPDSIDLNSVDLTAPGTAAPLTILWSGSGYTQTGDYAASVGGTMSAGITAVFSSYYGSLLSTTTPLTGSTTVGPFGSTTPFTVSSSGTEAGPGPFALTEQVVITGATAPDSVLSFDFDVSAIPEPSTVALLLTGGTGLALRRCKVKIKS